MPQIVADMIARYIRDRYIANDRALLLRAAISRKGRGGGGPIGAASFRTGYWLPLLAAAGIERAEPIHVHALRHFAGSWWLHQGLPLPDVSRLLGHANPGITMRIYIHEMMDAEQRASAIDTYAAALIAQPIAHQLRTAPKTLEYQAL